MNRATTSLWINFYNLCDTFVVDSATDSSHYTSTRCISRSVPAPQTGGIRGNAMGYADRLDYEQHATLDDPRERLEQRMRDEIQCASARQLSDLIGEYDCFDFEMALVCAIKDDPEVPVDHPICHALNALLDALVQRMADRQEKIERDSTPRRWRY